MKNNNKILPQVRIELTTSAYLMLFISTALYLLSYWGISIVYLKCRANLFKKKNEEMCRSDTTLLWR